MPYIGPLNERSLALLWRGSVARPAAVEKPSAPEDARTRRTAARSPSGVEFDPPSVAASRHLATGDGLVPNRTPTGSVQSHGFHSAKAAIAAMLGVVTSPPPSTIKVNGKTVVVDLAVDSLSMIAARVLSDAGVQARVEEQTRGESTVHRLVVDGEVTPATPADMDAASLIGFFHLDARSAPAPELRTGMESHAEPDPGEHEASAGADLAADAPAEPTPSLDARLLRVQEQVEAERAAMLEHFTTIDAALHRIREQTAPLAAGVLALRSGMPST